MVQFPVEGVHWVLVVNNTIFNNSLFYISLCLIYTDLLRRYMYLNVALCLFSH